MRMFSAGDGKELQTPESPVHFHVENVNVWAKKKKPTWMERRRAKARSELNGTEERHIIQDITLDVMRGEVLAIIGPSGCGKSTLLRCFNRMNQPSDVWRFQGKIELDGRDIYDPQLDVIELRTRVGWIHQVPNPFPKSIFENVAYGPRIHGLARDRAELEEIVKESLARAGLYDEVKDRLQDLGNQLSGGQKQRLCIARALAVSPETLLMDEPCASLDPIATAKVEELIDELRDKYTIIIVTHNIGQAGRIADRAAFLSKIDPEDPTKIGTNESLAGSLIEIDKAEIMVTNPSHPLTQGFVTGRFG